MPVLDFETLSHVINVPASARRLLEHSEKEIYCSISLRVHTDRIIEADCYVVYHSLARGPAKGGIRMSPSVGINCTRDLAERMTYKSSLVGLPFGGGKSGISLDPSTLTRFEKTAVMREYCHMLHLELEHGVYIPAPDMGTDATDMAVIYGRFDRPEVVTGKPPRVGGLPGRNEATGNGVAHTCALGAAWLWNDSSARPLEGKRVAVQGFGNVGRWTVHFLHEAGARIVAVSDINGGVYDEKGVNFDALWNLTGKEIGVTDIGGSTISNRELLALDTDILVPAAMEKQITADNAQSVRAKLIVEGANGPITPEADEILASKNIPVVPDILANAGGVIASYVEWRNAKSGSVTRKQDTYCTIKETLTPAFERIVDMVGDKKVSCRTAAQAIALSEVIEAMRDRSWI